MMFVASSLYAVPWYRCIVPGVELMKRGHEVELRDQPGELEGRDPDVLVSQAWLQDAMFHAVDRINANGGLTVYDMDDDPWSLHPQNPGYPYWSDPETQLRLAELMRSVRKVTTTTPELAERLAKYNKDVTVLPNMLPSAFWPDKRRETRDTNKLVVGWAGSISHVPDLKEIDAVIFDLLDRYPQIEVHMAGASADWLSRTHDRIKFFDAVPIEQYPELLAGFDIGLAPLINSKFNQAKSDLKALEYAMAGVPFVGSKIPAYARVVKQGETGFLAAKYADWMKHARALIESAELRDSVAEKARAWAETRTIERNMADRERVYGLRP